MWGLITSLLGKWALFRVILRTLGRLAWLLPVAFLLKALGLPFLILLAVLALPVFIVLAIVGLPLIAVVVLGSLVVAAFFALLSMGLVVLKIAIPVLLVVWFIRWLRRADHGPGDVKPATD